MVRRWSVAVVGEAVEGEDGDELGVLPPAARPSDHPTGLTPAKRGTGTGESLSELLGRERPVLLLAGSQPTPSGVEPKAVRGVSANTR